MHPSDEVFPLSIFETEDGREVVKSADVIVGHDEAQGGKPVVFFGRDVLDRMARTGVSEEINIVRIAYDSRTDQLEYLAAAVQALKGSCCYEATMPAPKTESWMLPDGTLEVRTTDADPWFAEDRAAQDVQLQAALDAFRAGGCPRPVVFTCAGQDEKTAQVWRQLEPELKQAGKSVANAADQWLPHYVVATDVARRLLLSVFGKAASRLFRTPGWPVGYWSVDICAGGHKVYESRTFKDMGEAKKK